MLDREDDAVRAVACVNACAGINPEAVPDVLEALRAARNWFEASKTTPFVGTMETIEAIRAALAKAEGKS